MKKQPKNMLSRFVRADRGIAAIEFAFIFPVVALMYFGMLDLTNFITINRKVTNAAGVMADLVTANDGYVLGTSIADYYNAPDIILSPIPSANIRVELYDFKIQGGAVSQRWALNNGRGPSCGGTPASGAVIDMMTDGNDVLVTRVCTNYQPFFGAFFGSQLLGNSTIKLTKNIYERPRLSIALNCFATVKDGAGC
jgi:Flp pilus assembly pilin Flp